jgi:hypothetical protein
MHELLVLYANLNSNGPSLNSNISCFLGGASQKYGATGDAPDTRDR